MDTKHKPETLLVMRDGQLDYDYYELVYAQKRKQALRQARVELINWSLSAPAKLGKGIAQLVVNAAN